MRPLWIVLLLALFAFPVAGAAQGGDVVWRVSYYDNGYLIGNADATDEIRGPLTLDWGTSAPADGIPADFFSARFGTQAYFSAGTWRFSVLADDGVAVYVDSQKIIDTFEAGSPAQNLVAEVRLSEGFHNIQVDYREAQGAAYLYVRWGPAGVNVQPDPFPEPSSPQVTAGRWLAEFYNNTTLTPPRVFANDTPSPVANWGTDAPVPEVNPEAWSARFSTRFFLNAGRYRVTVRADDGVRYYIDGRLLIDEFGPAQNRTFSGEFEVASGQHDIVIEHVEYGGTASLTYTLTRIEPSQETFVGGSSQPVAVGSAPSAPSSPATEAATGVTATVTARFVNIRAEPRVARGNIVATASAGQTYPVVGRANNGWVQLEVNGVRGWVSGRYVNTPGIIALPVTAEGPTD